MSNLIRDLSCRRRTSRWAPVILLLSNWTFFCGASIATILSDRAEKLKLFSVPEKQITLQAPDLVEGQNNNNNTHDSSNLIFASFLGLLQQWPNSFAYSGHSIIPGIIPRSTLLYHGLNPGDGGPPQGVEWLAFDPDMSYSIHSMGGSETRLLTYISERPLRVIYFDGQSASIGRPGFMDAQSAIIDGKVPEKWPSGSPIDGEYQRAHDLCELGKEWGFEGVVRMNTGFELIWCDFKKGIKQIENINTTDPFIYQVKPSTPSRFHPNTPFFSTSRWMAAQSATWHNFAPGEARVILDPSGLVSFYDRIDSLAEKRRIDGTDDSGRQNHRLFGISKTDVQKIRQRLIKVLERKNRENWAINSDRLDWRTIALTISKQYEHRLKELAFVLKASNQNATMAAMETRVKSYAIVMPYVDFSNYTKRDSRWLDPSIERCATLHTSHIPISKDEGDFSYVIKGAIEGTLYRMCRTVSRVFAETMEMELPVAVTYDQELEKLSRIKIEEWREQIDDLIRWLGWSFKVCDPGCTPDEICMPPMWPACHVSGNSTSLADFPRCIKSVKLVKVKSSVVC